MGQGEAPDSNDNRNVEGMGALGSWSSIYDPRHSDVDINREHVQGRRLQGGEDVARLSFEGGQPGQDKSAQEMKAIMREYAEDAERAMARQAIPGEYKELVRLYYQRFQNEGGEKKPDSEK